MKLMRSISGIRGIVGNTLTPQTVISHTKAFLDLLKAKRIVIGRDSRPTGVNIAEMVCGVCTLCGVEVMDAGLATTPTVELLVEQFKADGGIIVTASHNPIEWNALKFLNSRGMFLGPSEAKELFAKADAFGKKESISNSDDLHIRATIALPYVDTQKIKERKFKVAVDAVNGAGSFALPKLLESLGCEVVKIHCEPNGIFPRGAEPLQENLSHLSKVVKENKCDIGFALDPDADRCAIVSERGEPIGEEYTLAIAAETVLERDAKPLSINLSTSRMCEDLAEKFGTTCYRAAVGEINVSLDMIEHHSVVGGEGNGGVILPALHYGRDSLVSAALVLDLFARQSIKVSDWVKNHPSYAMLKKKFEIKNDVSLAMEKAEKAFADWKADKRDGLWLGKEKSFVHLRASNTEPVIRIIAEAPTLNEAETLCKRVEALI
ncbi:MAG: phosphoglucosamine mutase [Fibromonadaceae bacterium]|jgi:phosphomannomutase|nr:phosphoglucosamine mutase [Fibromonadaceae bacterium]